MLNDFIGQPKTKHTLLAHVVASKQRGVTLPNVLLDWPPGMGKTTLAFHIADELRAPFRSIDMTTIDGKSGFFEAVYDFPGGVILLDELHSVTGRMKESLLPFVYHGNVMRRGQLVRTIPHLTVIGATTDIVRVPTALISRFPLQLECEPYSDDDMAAVLNGFIKDRQVKLSTNVVAELAIASGGVPRDAESLAMHAAVASKKTTEEICRLAQMEYDGLRTIHIRYLQVLYDNKLELAPTALASALNVSSKRLVLVEDLLRRRGYITNGAGYRRELTPAGIVRIVGEQQTWTPN